MHDTTAERATQSRRDAQFASAQRAWDNATPPDPEDWMPCHGCPDAEDCTRYCATHEAWDKRGYNAYKPDDNFQHFTDDPKSIDALLAEIKGMGERADLDDPRSMEIALDDLLNAMDEWAARKTRRAQ